MAEVDMTTSTILKVNQREFRLILKGLAKLAGLKVTSNGAEAKEAEALNHQLLTLRHRDLENQLEVATAALDKATEAQHGKENTGRDQSDDQGTAGESRPD